MMEYVVDFLGYMFFSSLEYLMIFIFIFSFFRLSPEHYRKEILTLTIVTTFISYLLILTNIYSYVPLPIILIPITSYLIVKLTSKKKLFVGFISSFGFIFYGALQFAIAKILIYFGFVLSTQINDPFSYKTYIAQVICVSITLAVSSYIRFFNGGFHFNFKSERHNKRIIIYVTLGLVILSGLNCTAFLLNETSSNILITASVLTTCLVVFIYLSYKSEKIEHTFKGR